MLKPQETTTSSVFCSSFVWCEKRFLGFLVYVKRAPQITGGGVWIVWLSSVNRNSGLFSRADSNYGAVICVCFFIYLRISLSIDSKYNSQFLPSTRRTGRSIGTGSFLGRACYRTMVSRPWLYLISATAIRSSWWSFARYISISRSCRGVGCQLPLCSLWPEHQHSSPSKWGPGMFGS